MTVYVDDMHKISMGKYGRMKMSHMIADTIDELHDMAEKIGIQRKWFQCPPRASYPHYDICIAMRKKAIEIYGAKEVTMKELVKIIQAKRGPK